MGDGRERGAGAAPAPEREGASRYNTRLPEALHAKAKDEAARRGISLSALIEDLLEEELGV